MLALAFLAGLVIGAAVILAWAFILGQRSKAQQAKQTGGFHFAGIGDRAEVPAHIAYQLKSMGLLDGEA